MKNKLSHSTFITARIRRMGKVMFSVCPHLGGGQVSPAWGGGQVSPAGGGSVQPAGGGGGQVSPASGWGSVQLPGGRGQHLVPSCGRYASCVHAGGLSYYHPRM